MTVNLDDPEIITRYDAQGMLRCLHEVPRQCQAAWEQALSLELPEGFQRVRQVVIAGMGGSAIGGDLVKGLVEPECPVPIIACRDYHLPAFVDENTLVIASSYSGDTEETLSAFKESFNAGARKLVITTGGKLASLARQEKVPLFLFGYPAQPRAALPYSVLPLLAFLQKLGFIRDQSADVSQMVATLQNLSLKINEQVATPLNPAKQLAQTLSGHLVVLYGAGFTAGAAHRWKTQLNENSKAWAFHEVLPEADHNAVAGYQFPAEVASQVVVVFLHSPYLPERLQRRYQLTADLLSQAGVRHEVIAGEGNIPLSQMMSLVLLGDYISYYLALLYQVDPSPVKAIEYLKARLTAAG